MVLDHDANRSKLLLKLKWIRFWSFSICGFYHCVSVLRKTLRISVEIRTNTGAWQHCHLNIMSSMVWKKKQQFFAGINDTTVVTHKQTFSRPACATKKKGYFYNLNWVFHSAPAGLPGFTSVSHGSGFLKSLEPAANGNGLLSGFLSRNRRPPLTVRVIVRGYQEKF